MIFALPLVVPVIGTVVGIGLAPAVIATYLLMVLTSCAGIGQLIVMRRRSVISPRFFWLHLILHLIFVADIISAYVVSRRLKESASRRGRPGPPDGPPTRGQPVGS